MLLAYIATISREWNVTNILVSVNFREQIFLDMLHWILFSKYNRGISAGNRGKVLLRICKF